MPPRKSNKRNPKSKITRKKRTKQSRKHSKQSSKNSKKIIGGIGNAGVYQNQVPDVPPIESLLLDAIATRNQQDVRMYLELKDLYTFGIDAIDEEGYSIVMHAVVSGDIPITEMLIQAGADIYFTGEEPNSYNAVILAISSRRPQMANWLIENFPEFDLNLRVLNMDNTPTNPMTIAAQLGYDDVISNLLKKDTHIHIGMITDAGQEIELSLPLEKAILQGHHSTIRLLLENGSSVQTLNPQRENVLEVALKAEKPNVLTTLTLTTIFNYAPPGIDTYMIENAITLAVNSGKHEHAQLLQQFLQPTTHPNSNNSNNSKNSIQPKKRRKKN